MSLTRIDCNIYRGPEASAETSSYVALNPTRKPGSLVVACSSAARDSIGSQVACKLSIEHFLHGVLEYFETPIEMSRPDGIEGYDAKDTEISLEVLEAAFRNANSSVYSFGHQLAAGGRMAASLLGLVVEDNVVAAGRVGGGTAYLFRRGELFPFFEATPKAGSNETYVGSNSLVTVELASVPIEEGDILVAFSSALSLQDEGELIKALDKVPSQGSIAAEGLARELFPESRKLAFCLCAIIGPNTIYLDQLAE